ncbi:MAG: hypothetical protein EXR36_06635 [Betaproteobacteria bacterium]|nr:hypothetical protein [Betaproteobacteria bacterium]
MRTESIREYIGEAWKRETSHGQFAALVRKQLLEAGQDPKDAQAEQEILQMWRAQLERLPNLLVDLHQAAKKAGVSQVANHVIEAAEAYLLKERDLLPDSHGIMGLIDDMYVALSLILNVSEGHRANTGLPLLGVDLRESVEVARGLFQGARLAKLDQHIQTVMDDAGVAYYAVG